MATVCAPLTGAPNTDRSTMPRTPPFLLRCLSQYSGAFPAVLCQALTSVQSVWPLPPFLSEEKKEEVEKEEEVEREEEKKKKK